MLQDLLRCTAERTPEQIAVIDRGRAATYRELDLHAERLAAQLRRCGIGRSDRVGIDLDKSLEAVVAIFAVLKVGAAYVPLDSNAPVKRIAMLIEDCRMKGIITNASRLAKMQADLPVFTTCVVKIEAEFFAGDADLPCVRDPEDMRSGSEEDLAYILYTSGSTGRPKGVMISHRAALSFVDWAANYARLGPGDRVASHAPFHFDLSIFDLFATLKAGATVVLVPAGLSIFARSLADWIEQQALTVWYSVPSALIRLVLHGALERHRFRSLRLVLFAGEPFPVVYLRRLQRSIPHAAYHNLYGPTETNVCTAHQVNRIPDDHDAAVPIGRACAGCELSIVDEHGEPCKPGELGELWIAGASTMSGYWGMPAHTAQAFAVHASRPGLKFYRTGDLVFQDASGVLYFRGRRDTQVKSRGYRIELSEIESVLCLHPAVVQAAVVPVPDEEIGCSLHAVLVVLPDMTITVRELTQFCAERLPAYMAPHVIDFRSHLPLTATGKLDRQKLSGMVSGTATHLNAH